MQHNISQNYLNANGAGDTKMKTDIILSEISKLIVNNPERVTELLNKNAGAKLSKTPGTSELVTIVSDALSKHAEFAKVIAMEIIGMSAYNADATAPTKTDWTKILGNVSDIVNGMGNIFGGKKAAADAAKAKAEAEKALHEKTKTIAELKGKTSGIGKYVVIGLVSVAAIGIGFFAYLKMKK